MRVYQSGSKHWLKPEDFLGNRPTVRRADSRLGADTGGMIHPIPQVREFSSMVVLVLMVLK